MTSQPAPPPRVDILGVGVSAIDLDGVLSEIIRWFDNGITSYVCATGVHGIMECQRDPELREIHDASGLTTPDGMPLVWAGRAAGANEIDRVRGADLMSALCALSVTRGWSSFFYGGGDGTAELLASRLVERYPGLRVAGTYTPPFRPLSSGEARRVNDMINESGADLVWVGLSTPKQERWMATHRPYLRATALLGVGAAFDMHAGLLPQAPLWLQRNGGEWLYRLWQEPRRLWRRYLRNNPAFVWSILRRRPSLVTPATSAPRGVPAQQPPRTASQ